MCILELFTLQRPYAHLTFDAAVFVELSHGHLPDLRLADYMRTRYDHRRLCSLLRDCWRLNALERPAALEIVARIRQLPVPVSAKAPTPIAFPESPLGRADDDDFLSSHFHEADDDSIAYDSSILTAAPNLTFELRMPAGLFGSIAGPGNANLRALEDANLVEISFREATDLPGEIVIEIEGRWYVEETKQELEKARAVHFSFRCSSSFMLTVDTADRIHGAIRREL